jgi:hypothetical protein
MKMNKDEGRRERGFTQSKSTSTSKKVKNGQKGAVGGKKRRAKTDLN